MSTKLQEYRATIKDREVMLFKCNSDDVAEAESQIIRLESYKIDLRLEVLSIIHDGLMNTATDEYDALEIEYDSRAKLFFPELSLEEVFQLMVDWEWEQKNHPLP